MRARKEDKEKFFDKATLYIMTSYLNQEDRDKLAAEVDAYPKTGTKIKIPIQVLRWLGTQYLNDKNYEQAEKYLDLVTARKDEVAADDWLNLGRSFSGQRRSVEAVQAFKSYLEGVKEPVPRATGLLALGDAQLSLGQFDDAQSSVDAACALEPEGRMNAEGRILSGEIQMARGNYDDAAKLFESVTVLLDDPAITPHAMELAVDALKKAGKDAEAATMLNQLQTKYAEYLAAKVGRELSNAPAVCGLRHDDSPQTAPATRRAFGFRGSGNSCSGIRACWQSGRHYCFRGVTRDFGGNCYALAPHGSDACFNSLRVFPAAPLRDAGCPGQGPCAAFADKPLVKATGIVAAAPQEKPPRGGDWKANSNCALRRLKSMAMPRPRTPSCSQSGSATPRLTVIAFPSRARWTIFPHRETLANSITQATCAGSGFIRKFRCSMPPAARF